MDVEPNLIFRTWKESLLDFVLGVNLDPPDALHKMHKDFPVAPTKNKIDRIMFHEYQMGLSDQTENRPVIMSKLLSALFAEKQDTVPYTTPNFFVDLDLNFTKLHPVLLLKQKVVGTLHQPEYEIAISVK